MRSNRIIFKCSLCVSIICVSISIIMCIFSNNDSRIIQLIGNIIMAIFSGSIMTIVFSYIQMVVHKREIAVRFENILLRLIDLCDFEYYDENDYKDSKNCKKSYDYFIFLKKEFFVLFIELREIYYSVNVRTNNQNILSILDVIKYITDVMKKTQNMFLNFTDVTEWDNDNINHLLKFNSVFWYEIDYPESEEEIQSIAEKSNGLICGNKLVYSKIFFDIGEKYKNLISIYRFDL